MYGKWADRRKRSSTTEESEPLSDGSGTTPDCEKGFSKASKSKNESVDDHMVRPLCVELPTTPLITFHMNFDYPSTSTSLEEYHHPRRVQSPQVPRPMTDILRASPKPTHTWRALPLFDYRFTFAGYDTFSILFCTARLFKPHNVVVKYMKTPISSTSGRQ